MSFMPQGQAAVDSSPFELAESDRQVLALNHEDFDPHTWVELKNIIGSNALATLKRKPSDLVRYKQFTKEMNATYGSAINYICQERLHWTPLPSSTHSTGPVFEYNSIIPFAYPDDFKVLRNDWPYGLAPGITHLVVWLKNRLAINPETGDLTKESRQRVDDFVQKTFIDKIGREDAADCVLWFKNWSSIQSVRGLDHVHILVRKVPDTLLDEWMK